MAGRSLITVTLPNGATAFAKGMVGGLPAFGWGSAPAGLVTVRQLAAERLRPVGDRVALLVWGRIGPDGHYARWAGLYDVDRVADKRPLTPAMRAAIDAALAARRVCQICGPVDHYTRFGLCSDCFTVAGPTKQTT